MSTDIDTAALRMGVEELRTPEGQAKFAREAGDYIRDMVRETSFADKILTPTPVTENELVPGMTEGSSVAIPGNITTEEEDTVYAWRDIQVAGGAMVMNFKDAPRAKYINGKRYAIPLANVGTEEFNKVEGELLASSYDILKVVEDTAFLETHREKDRKFLSYCEQAVSASGQTITAAGPLQRSAFRSIQHPAIFNEIKPQVILMSEAAFTDLGLWDESDLGPSVADTTANGYTVSTVHGMTIIRSIKTKLFDTVVANELDATEMWCFPAAEFLGHNLYHGDYKVWSNWEGQMWRFQGWQRFGMGIGNIKGVTKLTIAY